MIAEKTLTEPLWQAAEEAFKCMIMLDLDRVDKLEKLDENTPRMVGSITFMGALQGAVVVQCDLDTARMVSRSMLMMGAEDEISDEEVEDALGEVVNLVLGGFKSRIANDLGEIQISVPMVIQAKDPSPGAGTGGEVADVFVKSGEHELQMSVVYKQK
ncbi:Chemotaxis protein CheC, inhibitor of MCP methylation [Anaerohalosphaera lusitana]|uniref:Chemotaxis protein CheC, inhibitor of MCP methylation n=1 Tax=Anaerohalosphaera lusitana TaxID=1936003 RepID=A0A1U9NPX1_9BACT|nr:chemotaxis protein CheX [Anaerohalosphaera lusitana]AQT69983.1 Chemotaxis protein CheC, inhibitor of MCP methylation [Anaerohalosphaera lusitana]